MGFILSYILNKKSSLSHLDITISRERNEFVTPVYRKPTCSGVFTNFGSFLPDMYKRGLTETLLHRTFRLCSNCENFHRETETLELILKQNNYPKKFVNHFINKCFNKLFIQKDINFTVHKRELRYLSENLRDTPNFLGAHILLCKKQKPLDLHG